MHAACLILLDFRRSMEQVKAVEGVRGARARVYYSTHRTDAIFKTHRMQRFLFPS